VLAAAYHGVVQAVADDITQHGGGVGSALVGLRQVG
jgi:hypothetical protein